jgi:hypothetical protein
VFAGDLAFVFGEGQRQAQHVAQLADVARPRVGHQRPHGVGRQARHRLAVGLPRQHRLDEQRPVGPFAQGRQAYPHAFDAVEQILAEQPFGHPRLQAAVGGGDDARVEADRPAPPTG